jgi:hypothetical protein
LIITKFRLNIFIKIKLIFIFNYFIYIYLNKDNGKLPNLNNRLKVQPHKDQDILELMAHAEDVEESPSINNIKVVVAVDSQKPKLEDVILLLNIR